MNNSSAKHIKKKKFKAVIFDMDGTIVDNIDFHRMGWISFLEKHGIMLKAEDFQAQNHGTIREMIRRFFGNSISEEKVAELGEEKEQTYRDLYLPQLKPVNGFIEFITALKKRKITIALATMGDRKNISFIIDNLKMRHLFDFITGGEEISKGKPDPEIFLLTAEKMGINPSQCLVIEDSLGGIESAKRAGMDTVGITTTSSRDEFAGLNLFKIINDFLEISADEIV